MFFLDPTLETVLVLVIRIQFVIICNTAKRCELSNILCTYKTLKIYSALTALSNKPCFPFNIKNKAVQNTHFTVHLLGNMTSQISGKLMYNCAYPSPHNTMILLIPRIKLRNAGFEPVLRIRIRNVFHRIRNQIQI